MRIVHMLGSARSSSATIRASSFDTDLTPVCEASHRHQIAFCCSQMLTVQAYESVLGKRSMLSISNYNTKFEQCHFNSYRPNGTFLDVTTNKHLVISHSRLHISINSTAHFIFASPTLRIEATHFMGHGVLEIATSGDPLRKAEIVNNSFDGVKLLFGAIKYGSLLARNNIGMNYRTAGHAALSMADVDKEVQLEGTTLKLEGVPMKGVNCSGLIDFSGLIRTVDPSDEGLVTLDNGKSFKNPVAYGSAVQCDGGTSSLLTKTVTGVAAGCDPRAQCQNLHEGGVKCTCQLPLTFKTGVIADGSHCHFQGQRLQLLQEETSMKLTIYKPENRYENITVRAQSEQTFDATISTDAGFLMVDDMQSVQRHYIMSTAKSFLSEYFRLTVLGNKLDWPDSQEHKQGFVVVKSTGDTQILTVNVILEPFGSCEQTDVLVRHNNVLHNNATGLKVQMVARDTDGHPIVRNRVAFEVQLVYEKSQSVELAVVRDNLNGSIYEAVVPAGSLRQEGMYHLEVEMQNAWNDTINAKVRACVPQKWRQAQRSFRVKCALGFYPDQEDGNTCKQQDLNTVCETASIFMDDSPVGISEKSSTLISESSKLALKIQTSHSGVGAYEIRFVPLQVRWHAQSRPRM